MASTTGNSDDGFVFKVDTDGKLVWHLNLQGSNEDYIVKLYADSSAIYALGISQSDFSAGSYEVI